MWWEKYTKIIPCIGYLESSNSAIRCPFWDTTLLLSSSATWPKHSVKMTLTWPHLTCSCWLPHWPHRKLLWLCPDTVCCYLLHSCYCPDQSATLPLAPHPWECPRVGCIWETIAVLLGARMSHLSLDHMSYPLSSPLAGARQNAQFSTGLPFLACPCPRVSCISARTWIPGVIVQGNARKESVSHMRVKGGNQTFIYLLTLEALYPSNPQLSPNTGTHTPLWNGKEFTEGHTQTPWQQKILRPHMPPTREQRSWVTVGAAASTARG